jgi:hypothetical protein
MFFNVFVTGPVTPHPETDYRIPTVNAAVASYPKGTNVLGLTWPLPRFTEKLGDKDDPQHTIRNG